MNEEREQEVLQIIEDLKKRRKSIYQKQLDAKTIIREMYFKQWVHQIDETLKFWRGYY